MLRIEVACRWANIFAFAPQLSRLGEKRFRTAAVGDHLDSSPPMGWVNGR